MDALWVVMSVQFVAALAAYPALRLTGWIRLAAFAGVMTIVMAGPLGIDRDQRAVRLLGALWAALLTSKLYDFCGGVRPDERLTSAHYVVYLLNPTWIVHRRPPRTPPWRVDSRRLALRLIVTLPAAVACIAVYRFDWSSWPFALEHAAKAVMSMGLTIAAVNAWAAAWRLVGGTGMDPMGSPLTAPTIADFWRRWNRPAQSFFREYVYERTRGTLSMRAAMMAAFVVSAMGHEYIFSIAAGRVQGYQAAFFLIHGLAAVATMRVRPQGRRRAAWAIATFTFVIATAVLFGLSLNEIVPVYARRE